jgi:hypothetical protein
MSDMNSATVSHLDSGHLSYTERLILHALRQWVADQKRWPDVILEFNRTCGPRAATRICDALESAFRTLGLHARRQIRVHPPICCRVSQDELCVLNIVATYQSQSRLHCRALINWMVPGHAVSNLISDIDQVARGLFDAGYILETRRNSAYAGARLEHSLKSVH